MQTYRNKQVNQWSVRVSSEKYWLGNITEDLNLSASQWSNIEAIWMENKYKWNDSGKYFPSPSHGMVSSTYPLGI
jgi:hypothetical protein